MIARLRTALQRFEESWIGDLVGVICLFGILILSLYAPLLIGCPE